MKSPNSPADTATFKPADRGRVAPFLAMEVLREANALESAGHEVLHLEVGEPRAVLPSAVRGAILDALDREHLGYVEALGLPALRTAIAELYLDWYGATVPTDRIAVTSGASGGFNLALLSAFDAGARIGVAEPGYPPYRAMLQALNLAAVPLPCNAATGYQPIASMVDGLELDGLILASPANPTGSMLDDAVLHELLQRCRARGVRVIMDEIYHGLVYGRTEPTVAVLDPEALVINSFSKYFGLTGWRIGWMVAPPALAPSIERLSQSLYICASVPAQYAALAALTHRSMYDGRRQALERNRGTLETALRDAGIDDIAPADGAFYLYANIGRFADDSTPFCRAMLHEAGIAATPGVDFDPARGHRYVRFSYAGPEADIAAAAERLRRWLPAQRR